MAFLSGFKMPSFDFDKARDNFMGGGIMDRLTQSGGPQKLGMMQDQPWKPNAALGLGLGLMSGRTPQQGLANGLQAANRFVQMRQDPWKNYLAKYQNPMQSPASPYQSFSDARQGYRQAANPFHNTLY